MMGHSQLTFHTLREPHEHLRPRIVTDKELEYTETPLTSATDSPNDEPTYVPGLNAVADLYKVWWHAKENHKQQGDSDTLQKSLSDIQIILDNLPPELRWRGGLSRDPRAAEGHEIQMINILVSSFHVKSNLLQRYNSPCSRLSHESIVRSVS